ncbi:hypothetical protein PA7_26400 [Pseudonocardia asaccharolytica DSM 44247 = NBRC 16224]|uniref:Uncharacterized protein n=1 Tax=Pseudonocardia asaccharolytica DSM 44247 = NBRC 16224 TaxID=1123024 RepID=A0A511D2Q2_9PSEU|nr:hypothetical protein PA7_26400 [Pseudonocardia asaccharolytica DSM 44247 = NBRC 16224]
MQLATKFGIDRSAGDANRVIRGHPDYSLWTHEVEGWPDALRARGRPRSAWVYAQAEPLGITITAIPGTGGWRDWRRTSRGST